MTFGENQENKTNIGGKNMPTKIRYVSVKGKPQMQIITDFIALKIRLRNSWRNKLKSIH